VIDEQDDLSCGQVQENEKSPDEIEVLAGFLRCVILGIHSLFRFDFYCLDIEQTALYRHSVILPGHLA
jgi:hypothetical protein